MPQRRKQAEKSLRRSIKRLMLDRNEMTVRALAQQIGYPETTVSKAINHGKFPLVRAKIREVLGV